MRPLSSIVHREIVGVDLSGDNLRLAHLILSPNKKEVLHLLKHKIAGLSNDDISEVIKTSLNELKLKKPDIINIIPSSLVITKNIEVPSTNPQEIKEIINLQAGRHTPYSREEIVVTYIDIGNYKHSYTKILLIIVVRNIIKRQFEILNKAGLRPEKIILLPESLACFIPKILRLEKRDSPMSTVHVDENFSDFSVVFKNRPLFVRSIPIGTQHLIAEKERYQLKFIEELKRSIEAYQNEDIEKSPNLLVLTGAVEELGTLEKALNDNLHLPIKILPYFKYFIVSKEAEIVKSENKHSSFLNVIAPLLVWEDLKVDLVPEEVKLRKSVEERGRDLIKTGIFALTAFVLVFLMLIGKIYFKSAYLKDLNTKYQALAQETQDLEDDFAKVSLVKNYLSGRGYSLEILSELHEVSPGPLKLTDIRFDEKAKFSVKGTAESMSNVFALVDNMKESRYFKDVKTRYTTKRKEGLQDVTDFEIQCSLDKPLD